MKVSPELIQAVGRLEAAVARLKGDKPGHPFRGNQWNGGGGSREDGARASEIPSRFETNRLVIDTNIVEGERLFLTATQKQSETDWLNPSPKIAVEATFDLNQSEKSVYLGRVDSLVRRKGYAKEAVESMMTEFGNAGFETMTTYVQYVDQDSHSMMQKLGGVRGKETSSGCYYSFDLQGAPEQKARRKMVAGENGKSAVLATGNQGTFDSSDPDVTKAPRLLSALKLTKAAVDLKRDLVRKDMRKAISRSVFSKQQAKTERDFQRVLKQLLIDQMAEVADRLERRSKAVGMTLEQKGDLPGHPFRGNQWHGGLGARSIYHGTAVALLEQIAEQGLYAHKPNPGGWGLAYEGPIPKGVYGATSPELAAQWALLKAENELGDSIPLDQAEVCLFRIRPPDNVILNTDPMMPGGGVYYSKDVPPEWIAEKAVVKFELKLVQGKPVLRQPVEWASLKYADKSFYCAIIVLPKQERYQDQKGDPANVVVSGKSIDLDMLEHEQTKAVGGTKAPKAMLDPEHWRVELIDRLLPVMALRMAEAAKAQVATIRLDGVKGYRGLKGLMGLEEKHLSGQHDQSTHGRSGSTPELLRRRPGYTYKQPEPVNNEGRDYISSVRLDRAHPECKEIVLQELDRLTAEYGEIPGGLKVQTMSGGTAIGTCGKGKLRPVSPEEAERLKAAGENILDMQIGSKASKIAMYYHDDKTGATISLKVDGPRGGSNGWFGNHPSKFDNQYISSALMGLTTNRGKAQDVVVHEFGHALTYRAGWTQGEIQRMPANREVAKIIKSTYATKNFGESLAEAFLYYDAGGRDPAVVKFLEDNIFSRTKSHAE